MRDNTRSSSDSPGIKSGAPARYGPIWRYAFAVAAVALAFGLHKMLTAWVGPGLPPFILFYPAVIVVALFTGLGPGLLATTLTLIVVDVWIMQPIGQFSLKSPVDLLSLGLFVISGLLICIMAQLYRSRREKAAAYDRDLALAESREALRNRAEVIDQASDALIVREMDGTIRSWNRGAERLYGWSAAEAIGQSAHVLLRTPDRSVQEFNVALGQDGHWEGELIHVTRDGRQITVETRNTVTRTEDGRVLILESDRDITEAKHAEEALRMNEARLREANAELESRIAREEAANSAERAARRAAVNLMKDAVASRAQVEQAGDALRQAHDELELRVRQRTEELQLAYDKLRAETEEKHQIEAQLRQAQKMEALGTMAGGIAHDFNNILAAIVGFAELLHDHTAEGSRDARHAKRVLEAALRGRDIVRQMLAYSRRAEQERKPIQLLSIVKESVTLLRASTPSTISIRTNLGTDSTVILGDPVQIQQVLLNLATNAAHAMREKGGILDIELNDFTVSSSGGNHGIEPGHYARLLVRDTGTGMPPDIMDKVFDPFFTTKGVGEGTGLGLSVVQGIVRQSNGYIFAESEPGKGSVFTVYFPKIAEEPPSDTATDQPVPTGTERILFVDDEEALVEMGEELLAELGYEVICRTSSRSALSLLKEDPSRFDLVITDQTMPEMTGIELAKAILAVRPDMPIIMCTGFSHLVDAERAQMAGIKAFAMKPLKKAEIARTVRDVLDGE